MRGDIYAHLFDIILRAGGGSGGPPTISEAPTALALPKIRWVDRGAGALPATKAAAGPPISKISSPVLRAQTMGAAAEDLGPVLGRPPCRKLRRINS